MKKFLLSLLVSIILPPPIAVLAQEMYAENNGYGLLKYYFDDKRDSREGTTYGLQVDFSEFFPGYPLMPEWMAADDEWKKDVQFIVIDPSFDNARPTSAFYLFNNFQNLKKIEGMEYLHTENVTNMCGMFGDCRSLTEIDLSHFDTRKVTDMSEMFLKCFELKALDLSHFDTSNVTDMNTMFSGCEKLTSLDLSGWDTQKVTTMEFMFNSCQSLTTLDASHFDTGNVENMESMFAYCFELKVLDLRNFDMQKVTEGKQMFAWCRSLKTIYCNEDWSKTSGLTAETTGNMFYFCDSPLTGGNGTKWNESNKTDITYARPDEDGTPGYFTAKKNIAADPTAGYAVYTSDDNTLTFYFDDQINERDGEVYGMKYVKDEDSGYSFPQWTGNAWSVERVVFDPSYIDARPATMDFWFYGMNYLKSVENMEFLNTSAVTGMMGTFATCAYLQGIDLSHFNTSAVTDMSYMFSGCSTLYSLDLTRFDMKSVKSVAGMFSDCISLRTIYCNDDWSAFGITDSDNMFDYCSNLTGTGEGTKCAYSDSDTGISRALPCTAKTQGYFTAKPSASTGITGDLNGDGVVDAADVMKLVNIIMGE